MSTESHMVTGDKLPPLYKSLVLSLPLKKKKRLNTADNHSQSNSYQY